MHAHNIGTEESQELRSMFLSKGAGDEWEPVESGQLLMDVEVRSGEEKFRCCFNKVSYKKRRA